MQGRSGAEAGVCLELPRGSSTPPGGAGERPPQLLWLQRPVAERRAQRGPCRGLSQVEGVMGHEPQLRQDTQLAGQSEPGLSTSPLGVCQHP